MDYLKSSPYSIFVIPLVWGIYEFRKLRYQFYDILKIANDFKTTLNELNHKIENLSSTKNVLEDIQLLTKKINSVFYIPQETDKQD